MEGRWGYGFEAQTRKEVGSMTSYSIQMRLMIASLVDLEFWSVMISNFLAAPFKSSGIAEAGILSADDEMHPRQFRKRHGGICSNGLESGYARNLLINRRNRY